MNQDGLKCCNLKILLCIHLVTIRKVKVVWRNTPINQKIFAAVISFSKKIANALGWKIIDEKEESRVALIAKEDYPWRVMKFD